MNELMVIEPTDVLPAVPDDWDYDISVEKTKTIVYKWKNLTIDILDEFWVAREMLSEHGGDRRSDQRDKCPIENKTWSNYCEEIGLEKRTVNRWLEKAYSSKKITTPNQPEFDEDIETDNECPNCGYEW